MDSQSAALDMNLNNPERSLSRALRFCRAVMGYFTVEH